MSERRSRFANLLENARFRHAILFLIFIALMWNGRQYPAGDGYDFGAHRDHTLSVYRNSAAPGFDVPGGGFPPIGFLRLDGSGAPPDPNSVCTSNAAYNPPLFYLFGSISLALEEHIFDADFEKIAKILLALLVFGLVYLGSRICGWMLGERSRPLFLIFIGTMPAFYRGAAMYIPEQFLSLIIWFGFYLAFDSWKRHGRLTEWGALGVAICLSLAVWTRPMAFAAVGAWGLTLLWFLVRDSWGRRSRLFAAIIVVGIVSGAVFALFGFNMKRFGSVMPYSIKQIDWSETPLFQRQPLSFYFEWRPSALFTEPARPGRLTLLSEGDIRNPSGFALKLKHPDDPLSRHLRDELSTDTLAMLSAWVPDEAPPSEHLERSLTRDLRGVLTDGPLFTPQRFAGVELSSDSRWLLGQKNLKPRVLHLLNRYLLHEAYPELIEPKKTLGNRWMPILYSDLWGDYWRYWTLNYEVAKDGELNRSFWTGVLALQNVLALAPTALMVIGFFVLSWKAFRAPVNSSLAMFVPICFLVILGMGFFLYFIISMPHPDTDSVKATYLCFLMPAWAISGVWAFDRLLDRRRFRWIVPLCVLFWIYSFSLVCIYWHNL